MICNGYLQRRGESAYRSRSRSDIFISEFSRNVHFSRGVLEEGEVWWRLKCFFVTLWLDSLRVKPSGKETCWLPSASMEDGWRSSRAAVILNLAGNRGRFWDFVFESSEKIVVVLLFYGGCCCLNIQRRCCSLRSSVFWFCLLCFFQHSVLSAVVACTEVSSRHG